MRQAEWFLVLVPLGPDFTDSDAQEVRDLLNDIRNARGMPSDAPLPAFLVVRANTPIAAAELSPPSGLQVRRAAPARHSI